MNLLKIQFLLFNQNLKILLNILNLPGCPKWGILFVMKI